MKKVLCAILIISVLLSFAACGSPRFESEEEMYSYLSGLWRVDTLQQDRYLAFVEGEIYQINAADVSSYIEKKLDNVLKTEGCGALLELQERNVYEEMLAQGKLGVAFENVEVNPKKGIISINPGEFYEEQIIVEGDHVGIKDVDDEYTLDMDKLSDKIEFPKDKFQEIYRETVENYTISIAQLAYSPEAYGEIVRTIHPEIDSWYLTENSNDLTVYTTSGTTHYTGGLFMVSKDDLLFSKGIAADGDSDLRVMYDLEGVLAADYELFVHQESKSSPRDVLRYAEPLLQLLPGAPTVNEIIHAFERNGKVSYGMKSFEETVNGYRYMVTQNVTGDNTSFYLYLPTEIKLSDIPEDWGEQQEPEATEPDTLPEEEPTQSAMEIPDGPGLFGKLDYTKTWRTQCSVDGYPYNLFFVFQEDGKCYFVLSEWEIIGGGEGTYQVSDPYTLTLDMTISTVKFHVTYTFDPATNSLTIVSDEGILGKKGEVYRLEHDPGNDVEKIKSFGMMLANAY